MKRFLLMALLAIATITMQAQSDVYLKIDHFLGASSFALNTTATNNIGNEFKVTRLEYYIAEIKIVHDGGQVTAVPNKWILVNATSGVNELLGSFNITNLEGVKFSIGVESPTNHSDPAGYATGHPLAPKMPSMHWGWAAGYRFVAMEGKSGNGFAQTFQFHSLEDKNYHTFTIMTAGMVVGSDISIGLNADYIKALNNIDVSTGPIIHGGNGDAAVLLVNFNRDVFTSKAEGNASVGIAEDKIETGFALYPNPSNGSVNIEVENNNETLEIVVTDLVGNTIKKITSEGNEKFELSISESGIYFISVVTDGEYISTQKLVITD